MGLTYSNSREARLDKREVDLNTQLGELDILTQDLNAREKESDKRDKDLTAESKELDTLTNSLDAREEELGIKKSTLTTREDILTTREEELVAREDDFNTKDINLTKQDIALSTKETEIDQLGQILNQQEIELDIHRQELAVLSSQLDDKSNSLESKTNIANSRDDDLSTYAKELAALEATLDAREISLNARAESLDARVAIMFTPDILADADESVEKFNLYKQTVDCKVVSVYDGDTVHAVIQLGNMNYQFTIRMNDYDELDQDDMTAKEELSSLINGKQCQLLCGGYDKYSSGERLFDKFGRMYGTITLNDSDISVNQNMLNSNFGISNTPVSSE
jgi:hypothetical protein